MALFTGTTEAVRDLFRQFVPVTASYPMKDVLAQLASLEMDLLARFLGEVVATQIVDLSDEDPATLSVVEKKALELARSAVARIGFADFMPFAEVQIGGDGVTISAIEGRKAAFQYQTKQVTQKLLDSGWANLDRLVSLVAANTDVFVDWPESPYFIEHTDALFKNATEFSKYYPIQERWLTFWALRPFIRAVEENQGAAMQARIDALPTSVSEAQKKNLHKKLLRALAYQSILEGMPNLSIELNGVNLQVNYSSQYGNVTYYEAPGKEQLTWVLDNLKTQTDFHWSTVNDALVALTPADPDSSADGAGTSLIYSTGAITFL